MSYGIKRHLNTKRGLTTPQNSRTVLSASLVCSGFLASTGIIMPVKFTTAARASRTCRQNREALKRSTMTRVAPEASVPRVE